MDETRGGGPATRPPGPPSLPIKLIVVVHLLDGQVWGAMQVYPDDPSDADCIEAVEDYALRSFWESTQEAARRDRSTAWPTQEDVDRWLAGLRFLSLTVPADAVSTLGKAWPSIALHWRPAREA